MKKIQRILTSATLAGAVLASVAPSAMAATPTFTDVTGRYVEPVSALYSRGLIKGVSASKFGVHQNIKRVDAAVIIANSIGYLYDILLLREPRLKIFRLALLTLYPILKQKGL